MKRYGNLWDKIIDIDNLRYAHEQAKKGKSHYSAVKRVEKDLDRHLQELHESLKNKDFTTGKYQIEDRMEGGKMRRIYKLPYYPDRIVQHALMSVTGPIFRRSLIRDTFQSLPNRGTSDARRRVQKMMKETPQKYALKMDIKKYYPNVNSQIMKELIRKKIKCKDTLWLLDDIIDSMKGLPIGNLSSQYLGNVYLCWFDWWVKQDLNVKHYFRYCDDIVIFHNSMKQLRDWRTKVELKLKKLSLSIKPSWQILNNQIQGVDFVGYVFKTTQTKLRTTIANRFRNHLCNAKKGVVSIKKSLDGTIAYKGWLMRANTKKLWRKHVTHKFINSCNTVYKHNPIRGKV